MNLNEFVSESLEQIVTGICAAQERTKENGAIIVPENIWTPDTQSQPLTFLPPRTDNGIGRGVVHLEFDIGIEVGSEKSGEGKLTVATGLFGFGKVEGQAGGNVAKSEKAIHRVKFSVPVAFPTQNDSEQDASRNADKPGS